MNKDGADRPAFALWTASEVAAKLRVNVATVHSLLRGGILRGFRLKRRWRITNEALEKFMTGERTAEKE